PGAGGTAQLGERQKRSGARPAGMHEDLRVGVVEVEHVRSDALEQRSKQAIRPLASAGQRRLRRSGEGREAREGDVDRFMIRAADGAAGPVHERADRLAYYAGWQGVETRRGDIAG